MKKLNNRGFTLVELVVVIAVLGILSGVVSASVNQIFSGKIRKFVNSCDSMLTRCRVETLSGAPNAYVELRLDGDGKYYVALYEGTVKKEEDVLEDSNASCSYVEDGGATVVGTHNALRLSFNRTTGALNEECTQIDVSGVKITLWPATGYHQVGE